MKRFSSTLLCLCLLLSLWACGKPDPAQNPGKDSTTTSGQTIPFESAPSESTPSENNQADQPNPPEPEDSITPILYKLTDDAGNTAWLFGSIYVGEKNFYPLPDYVTSAYENSDALAVEFDVVSFASDTKAQTNALMQLIYMDGTTITDHIPEELYTQAVDVLKECGQYISALDMYCPALWSSFIESSMLEDLEVSADLGLDMHFLNDAHETGKEIQDVESAEFQYGMMADFSEELQILLLESSLYSYNNMDETATELAELKTAWASGDEEALVALLNEEPELTSEEEANLYAEYNDAMMTQRNISMADFAEAALTSGKEVFICVGAAHVVGPDAMVDLLTQRGYTLERVLP